MKSSVDILDAIAEKLGGASDYRIWKDTGIYHGTISSVRAGRCSLSRENCAKAAEILGVEVGALVAIVTAEREENPEIKDSLLHIGEIGLMSTSRRSASRRAKVSKLKTLTTGVALAVGLSVAPTPPAQASTAPQQSDPMFIMSSRRRRTARREKTPVYTGTYPTAVRVKRPTLHLRDAPIPSIPTTTT